jgi:uncharacterized integral membrane protein
MSGMKPKTLLALVLVALLALFAVQNSEVVAVHFLFWTVEMSRVVMLLGVLGVGAVFGWVLCSVWRRRSSTS